MIDRPLSILEIKNRLRRLANEEKAKILRSFFKTGPGQYGEGDIFLGITVPPLRKLAAEFQTAPLRTVQSLLKSRIHEERTLALMILVRQFMKGNESARNRIYELYLANIAFINNWDLVDGSAPYIIGQHLWERDRTQLYAFARSRSLWERRIAILSTFYFIRRNDFIDALRISELLLDDRHDLIHKAVGWMLREIGKRDSATEEAFLKKHHRSMPRTMLRYAIERFPEEQRRRYLLGT
jgi:3-methyladenine DNA glycosylase AlkD